MWAPPTPGQHPAAVRWRSEKQRRDLVGELQRSHHALLAVLTALLVVTMGSSGYLLLVSQPRVMQYTDLARQARVGHEGMLDQESGLRGWLATGDEVFLESYDDGLRASEEAVDELVTGSAEAPMVNLDVIDMMLARQTWEQWADRAAAMRVSETQRVNGRLSEFLLEGKRLFDVYRAAHEASIEEIVQHRDQALSTQWQALVAVLITHLLVLGGAGTLAALRRRRLDRSVLQPVRQVLSTIDALRSGDLAARSAPTGLAELDAMGSALEAFAADLEQAGELATAREARLGLLAARLETVIRVARETSGSLSIRYVSEAVTDAAADLIGTPTTLWVRSEDGQFRAARRSSDPHGAVPPSDLPSRPVVTAAAADARMCSDGQSYAYPMVLAGSVVGVLEVEATTVDADTEHVLEALVSTGAAALESAQLHSSARELAEVDALTRLPNRRRLEADLQVEWERCRRYDRPLSLAMVDLDNFKQLNDTHGHLVGDAALRAAADAVAATLRSTDTAYRYGGEEITVVLRETSLDEAAEVAERLRGGIAAVALPGSGVVVTASIGVAERGPQTLDHAALMESADAALYEAKQAGRNRVALARPALDLA